MAGSPSPGPWGIDDGFGGTVVVDRNDRVIAEVRPKKSYDEQRSNELLISGSYELLEAARRAFDSGSTDHLKRALFKITGDRKYL